MRVTSGEVDMLIREGEKLAPILSQTRILRAYAGVRPLVASDDDPTGRNVSRGIVLLDHEKRDGLEGFITITGGKLVTYRIMAECVTDMVCEKLNVAVPCTTAEIKLPGLNNGIEKTKEKSKNILAAICDSIIYRNGIHTKQLLNNDNGRFVCECEAVTVDEVKYAIEQLSVTCLMDLRRRTRLGMGTCQGELCACRAAGLFNEMGIFCASKAKDDLALFINERWKGIYPVAWGDSLRESEYISWIYESVCGLYSYSV
jgi:glycerol-3-phosphate dehydrogenase